MARVTGTARKAMRAEVGTVRKRTIFRQSVSVDGSSFLAASPKVKAKAVE
jgi:hypothetical protein